MKCGGCGEQVASIWRWCPDCGGRLLPVRDDEDGATDTHVDTRADAHPDAAAGPPPTHATAA